MTVTTIQISVTQKQLDTGLRSSFLYCAVAEAMKEVFANELFGIWDDKVEFLSSYQLTLPEVAVKAIKALDREQKVAPFVFDIDIELTRFKPETQQNLMKYQVQKPKIKAA